MALLQRTPTLDEFLKLRERKPSLEFEDGEVSLKVSPQGQHSRLQVALCDQVNRFTEPTKLALAFSELRISWNHRSYVPDVSVYRWDRIPRDERGRVANDFLDPPDIAIEIISPRQSVTRLVRKCLWYVDNGVRVALLVDPKDESVLLFRAGTVTLALRDDDRIDLSAVLPSFELTVRQLFDTLKLD